jgi:hypothetical protein
MRLAQLLDQDKSYNMEDDSGEPHQGNPQRCTNVSMSLGSQAFRSLTFASPGAPTHEDEALAELRKRNVSTYRYWYEGQDARLTSATESLENIVLAGNSRLCPPTTAVPPRPHGITHATGVRLELQLRNSIPIIT